MNNTSTALALIQPDELETIQRTGRMLAASGYFDTKGEGAQAIAQMATKILAGREIGIGPFAAVNGIHIIQGRPSIGANLLASAVKGSQRYDYRVREMTDKVCRIEFFERIGGKLESLGISEFTEADARKAGTKNMDKYAKNMLFARAMSNGVRFYTPDVFNGNAVYVPEELGAEVDGDGNIITVTGRPVDITTGEIQDNLHTETDVIFEKPVQALVDLRAEFHTLGESIYGVQWPMVCKRNVARVSGNVTYDANGLNMEQLQMLIDGMHQVKAKREQQAEAV